MGDAGVNNNTACTACWPLTQTMNAEESFPTGSASPPSVSASATVPERCSRERETQRSRTLAQQCKPVIALAQALLTTVSPRRASCRTTGSPLSLQSFLTRAGRLFLLSSSSIVTRSLRLPRCWAPPLLGTALLIL